MRQRVFIVLALSAATVAVALAGPFRSKLGMDAQARYEAAIAAATKQYRADLVVARDAAMSIKDLDEANALQAEIDSLKDDELRGPSVRSLDGTKWLWQDGRIVLSFTQQRFELSDGGAAGQYRKLGQSSIACRVDGHDQQWTMTADPSGMYLLVVTNSGQVRTARRIE